MPTAEKVSVLGYDPKKTDIACFRMWAFSFKKGDYQPEIKVSESTLSIGLLVGGIAKNMKSASVIACILYFPMLIFSGATLPFEVMPVTMQKIISTFPLTQGIQLMKAAFLGLPIENVLLPITVMSVLTLTCFGISVKCFKWE